MKPKLIAINQRPQDLILAVTNQDNLPDTQVLQQASWQVADYSVTFVIIGESHRVKIEQHGQFIMEEMLACVDVPTDDAIYQHSFQNLQHHEHRQRNYSVVVNIDTHKTEWQSTEQEIVYFFPQINSIQPVTRIQWQATKTAIQWRTLHTYIDNQDITNIYTQSHFSFSS